MKIYKDESLSNFNFWGGAQDSTEKLTTDELDTIESNLNELYPDGINETELNDLFWFEFETLCSWIGEYEEDALNRIDD